jgi:hypothetical protein
MLIFQLYYILYKITTHIVKLDLAKPCPKFMRGCRLWFPRRLKAPSRPVTGREGLLLEDR